MYLNLFSRMIAVAAIAAGSMLPIAANASTVSCPGTAGGDQITLDVSALTSCSSTNGNGAFSPLAGYTLITDNNFSLDEVTSGSFSPGTGYSSLELFIQSDTGPPHPDQFIIVLSDVSSFDWSLVGGDGQGVSEAELFGIATTPLPAALPLFAGGLGLLWLLSLRKRKTTAALA